jgi:PhnB protein
MAGKAKPVPEGYHTVTPYLSVRGAEAAIEFYRKAFGAEEIYRIPMPEGKVGHAELQIGSSRIMLADEFPGMPDNVIASPASLAGSSIGLNLYLPDVDAAFARAIAAGATVRRPVQDMFYGDRSGTLMDPYGHIWTVSTRIEDLTREEMMERMAALPQG